MAPKTKSARCLSLSRNTVQRMCHRLSAKRAATLPLCLPSSSRVPIVFGAIHRAVRSRQGGRKGCLALVATTLPYSAMSEVGSAEAKHNATPSARASCGERSYDESVTAVLSFREFQQVTLNRKREREPSPPPNEGRLEGGVASAESALTTAVVGDSTAGPPTSIEEAPLSEDTRSTQAAAPHQPSTDPGSADQGTPEKGLPTHPRTKPLVSFPAAPLEYVELSSAVSASLADARADDNALASTQHSAAVHSLPPPAAPSPSLTSPVSPSSSSGRVPCRTPRKTPVSTPTGSLNTPTPPFARSPASSVSASFAGGPAPAPDLKRAARVERWAELLLPAMMLEREPREEAAVKQICQRIAGAIPGEKQEAKDTFLMLLVNLKDPKNTSLRRRIVDGELPVEVLVSLGERDLVNPERRKVLDDEFEARAKDSNLAEIRKASMTSSKLFSCPKCKVKDCTWTQKQTRSADEPMTVFCCCNNCGNVWKKY